MSPDLDGLAAAVSPALAADPRVRFAYVFGSVAAGTATRRSDVDLAVSVRPRGTLLDDARLHDALVHALGRDDVDLVVLEDAPLWMRYRAVGGRPVYSRTTSPGCATAPRSSWNSSTSSPTTTPIWQPFGIVPAPDG
jgi:predicted nucleotidyltransferase